MHLRKPWVLVSVLAAFAVQAGVIYKWTDAEKIATSSSSLNRANSGPSQPSTGTTQPKPGASAAALQLTLISPSPEQVFFNDETVNVSLDVQPALKPTQAITWHLNGKALEQPPSAVSFGLQGLERGTYVLSATVVDQVTGDAVSSPTVTFYFRQPSALSPLHR
jgi:hypothetical protein